MTVTSVLGASAALLAAIVSGNPVSAEFDAEIALQKRFVGYTYFGEGACLSDDGKRYFYLPALLEVPTWSLASLDLIADDCANKCMKHLGNEGNFLSGFQAECPADGHAGDCACKCLYADGNVPQSPYSVDVSAPDVATNAKIASTDALDSNSIRRFCFGYVSFEILYTERTES